MAQKERRQRENSSLYQAKRWAADVFCWTMGLRPVRRCGSFQTPGILRSQFQGSEDKNYTYTIITTDSNKQLSFLHDRMPVILENGSDQIRDWLDPNRSEWTKELQSLLKPYDGELECYPVNKDVGRVGNNSPMFIVPVASTENKNNIANFFSNAKKTTKDGEPKEMNGADQVDVNQRGAEVEGTAEEKGVTVGPSNTEDNAPLPVPASPSTHLIGSKRVHEADDDGDVAQKKRARTEAHAPLKASPEKPHGKKARSAVNNGTKGSATKLADGSQRITRFFNK